jgi:hypothetical protein
MRTRVGVLALLVSLSAACGDINEVSSDGAPPGPDAAPEADAAPPGPCEPGGEPTYDEAYDCLIEAGCSLVTRCFLPYTVEQCKNLDLEIYDQDVYLHREAVRQGIAEGTIEFHPEEVAACFAAVTGKECTFIGEHGGSDFEIGDLCPGVLVGTVAAEGACFTGTECAPAGSECVLSPDCSGSACCPGTCLAPADDGESCDGLPCGLGSHCVGGICHSGEEDEPCGNINDCDEGFYCNGEGCVPELESGATCGFNEECPGPEICLIPPDSKSGTCARVDQEGAPCNEECMGLQCDQPDPLVLGTCVAYLAVVGAECCRLTCSFGFVWDRGADQCVPLGEVGAECTDTFDDCVPGLFCDIDITGIEPGHCAARLPDDEPCTSEDQCQSGICDTIAPTFGTLPRVCLAFPDCRVE